MDTIAIEKRLPADIDAQPVVQAAAALYPALRECREEIEREQRLPKALVEEMRAAGFYRMVIPRSLGGLEADPLTYLRVVELLAEGAGSVGWNLANNGIGQLVTLGLPDEGVQEIHGNGPATMAGTAVQGGGQAVPVAGGYRVSGRWSFGSGCQEAAGCSAASRSSTTASRASAPKASRCSGAASSRAPRPRSCRAAGTSPGLRGTGSFDWTVARRVPAGAADDGACRHPARQPMGALAGGDLRSCRPSAGSGRTTAR